MTANACVKCKFFSSTNLFVDRAAWGRCNHHRLQTIEWDTVAGRPKVSGNVKVHDARKSCNGDWFAYRKYIRPAWVFAILIAGFYAVLTIGVLSA